MAGGSGTRLWPLSRAGYPKQFLVLTGNQSLFQEAVGRLARVGGDGVAVRAPLIVGNDSTIGHNVELSDCRVGARTLVGMGSVIAPGTVIADDTFVAAGTHSLPGQLLESGWLWGGRPARALSRMTPRMDVAIRGAAVVYREYAAGFAASQQAAALRRPGA
jgi:carbonic anhydrase/acetyltransferase-like protein (isoleucine patch superfamily)